MGEWMRKSTYNKYIIIIAVVIARSYYTLRDLKFSRGWLSSGM
jgi:hypothetical protein